MSARWWWWWRPKGDAPPVPESDPEPADQGDRVPNGALAIDGRALLLDGRFLIVE